MLIDRHLFPSFIPVNPNYPHQEEVFQMSKEMKAFALLMEMGTGKTKVIIDNAIYLFLKQEIDGLLIIAPKGCYLNWETDEIPAHMPSWMPVRIAHWDADATNREVEILWALTHAKDNCLDIVLMNVEALSTSKGENYAKQFLKNHYPMGVIDESSCISSFSAARTKAVARLSQYIEYKRIMSGTPITQGPLDLFTQFFFLNPDIIGFRRWLAFKNYYAKIIRVEFGNRSYEKIAEYLNIDELKTKIAPYSYRKLKSECLDLPEKIFITRKMQLPDDLRRIYDKMKKEAMIEFSEKSMVSSTSALTTIMKLHQMSCGYVVDDYKKVTPLSNYRLKELISIVNEIEEKILIWCYYKYDVLEVTNALKDEYGDESTVSYYGDTGTNEREENLKNFKTNPKCRFFVSNETGSKSLTLIMAPYAINYSYDYKLETWLQQQDRNHRIGQTKNVTYITMIADKTVDGGIIKNLQEKKDIASLTIDDLSKFLK